MARQKVVTTVFPGKMKRLIRRGWILQGQSQSLFQPIRYTLVKPRTSKKDKKDGNA